MSSERSEGLARLRCIVERRRRDGAERRRQLADAAIELFGSGGARGLSHPKVDVRAGVPAGTTSFYFRTRQALLIAMAERLTELDVADLSRLDELAINGEGFAGTAGLAELVMQSAAEPFLTRTRARYELALHAGRNPDLMATLQRSVDTLYRLARDVVTCWHAEQHQTSHELIDEQVGATLAFLNGVMLSFVMDRPLVENAPQLERLLDGLIAGLTAPRVSVGDSTTEPQDR